jgi:hypothetical protein
MRLLGGQSADSAKDTYLSCLVSVIRRVEFLFSKNP